MDRTRACLMLRVHFDAFRKAPRAWLLAFWWRIVGKRLRSRGQFARLFSATPQAYAVWLLNEPETVPDNLPANEKGQPPLEVLVVGTSGADATRSSVEREGIRARVVDLASLPDALRTLNLAQGPWVLFLMAGDTLAPGAIAAYRRAAATAAPGTRVIYADDDLQDSTGKRTSPHFKPSWNCELFRHFDFLTGACLLRLEESDVAACEGSGSSDDWLGELVSRVASRSTEGADPLRLPKVLHHRTWRPLPRVPSVQIKDRDFWPRVSVIVPTRNRLELLSTCIEGLERTDYPNLEVIVVDNGSDDRATLDYLKHLDRARYRVIRDEGDFNFSRLNNCAARMATGDLLCLLNNDIEVGSGDWLKILVEQALRPEVGAVGAQLLYPDGRIQHAGVLLGICGGAAHAHCRLDPSDEGYFHRHALPQFVMAVTAACLVLRRECFEAIGGLDEENFAVAFNDVDMCLKLNEHGWQSFYEPRAVLIHHESVSRGFDRDSEGAARLEKELQVLKDRWGTGDMERDVDPYHHPQLSRYSENFVVQLR